MTGAEFLLSALQNQGVSVCFANPGTTELDLVRAFESEGSMRCVIGLQENVCTGAADGYGRMTGEPAITLLHLGPGFANGIANLHNARRARTPIINVIGDQTSWHLPYDAPLTSDIDSLAKPVSGWVHRIISADECGEVAAEAIRQTGLNGGQGVTLIFPADHQSETTNKHKATPTLGGNSKPQVIATVDPSKVKELAKRLQQSTHTVFLLGGGGENSALGARAQRAVARLCALPGKTAFAETFPSRSERGQGLPAFDRLPYFPEPARKVLDQAKLVVLVGAQPPVTYFGYAGQPSMMVEEGRLFHLCDPGTAAADLLESLADALDAPPYQAPEIKLPSLPTGDLNPEKIASVLVRELPANAIVSVEGGTCGYPFYAASAAAKPHVTLTNTGGAIGQGLPVAMGAAIACPDRKVVALVSDGSTQYTIQTLWSMAHEGLDIVIFVAANHQYAILRNELRRGGGVLSEKAAAMTSLDHPRIDWVQLAQSYGVTGSRAQTAEELTLQAKAAFSRKGPTLIEMAL